MTEGYVYDMALNRCIRGSTIKQTYGDAKLTCQQEDAALVPRDVELCPDCHGSVKVYQISPVLEIAFSKVTKC